MTERVLVIGLGQVMRGDDQIGLLAADFLQRFAGPWAKIVRCEGLLLDTFPLWAHADKIICIDACTNGGPPGSVQRWSFHPDFLGVPQMVSSHAFGVVSTLRLAQSLGKLPKSFVIYTISADQFEIGRAAGTELTKALPIVASLIEQELNGKPVSDYPATLV